MKKNTILDCIATDKYNLLIDGENRILYAIKKAWLRFLGYGKNFK